MQLPFPLNIDHARTSVVFSNFDERIRISGLDADFCLAVVQAINDGRAPAEAARAFPDNARALDTLLSTLASEKILIDRTPAAYSGAEMADLLRGLYGKWNQNLFSHRLWLALVDGSASDELVDGWLVESYHFIRGANARLCYASSFTFDERIRAIFAKHYVEEYDHYKFFAESLTRRGLDVQRVDEVGPRASTLAVLNMARRAARIDCLAYAACSGLLESTGSDTARAKSFYQSVEKNFDRAGTGFVCPMIKHVELDEALEHGSVMDDVFRPLRAIDAERADKIVETASVFQETLQLWFSDICDHYLRRGVGNRRAQPLGRL